MTYRVSNLVWGIMLAMTIIGDGLQFILLFAGVGVVVDTFIEVAVMGPIYLWLALLGVSFIDGKKRGSKFASVIATSVIELIPVLDALPGMTIGLIALVHSSRQEDKLVYEEQQRATAARALEEQQQTIQRVQAQQRFYATRARQQAANDNEEALEQAA